MRGELRLVAFGDTDVGEQAALASCIAALRPPLSVFLGDATPLPPGIRKTIRLRRWRRTFSGLAQQSLEIRGNHDPPEFGTPGERSLRWIGDSVVVVGISPPPEKHSVTNGLEGWLEEHLAPFPNHYRVVCLHEPLFPCASRIGLSYDRDPRDRDVLLGIFERATVDLLLTGHEHAYVRRSIGQRRPLLQVTSGGGGAVLELSPLANVECFAPVHHFLEIREVDNRLFLRAATTAGVTIDAVALERAVP